MVQVGGNGAASGCGDRYAVEGVAFRFIEIDESGFAGASQETRDLLTTLMAEGDQVSLTVAARRARLSRLRNALAQVCYGTEEQAAFRRDPFRRDGGASAFLRYGALDRLQASGALTDCDVPLALVYWSLTGVKFVDMWSARRRPTPITPSQSWPLPVTERQRVEGEARFQQFQDHLETLLSLGLTQAALGQIQARSYFQYLPPAGLFAITRGARSGLVPNTFLGGLPLRQTQCRNDLTARDCPMRIDDAHLPGLLRDSLDYPPIDLSQDELIWLYQPWQNDRAAESDPTIQPYVVFASGQMPPAAIARFDVARWDNSDFWT